ncbi:MAG: hypothetical protein WC860_04875 [Candidatus Margulisiibacteriota bacterium]|jgi:hypothetical protein
MVNVMRKFRDQKNLIGFILTVILIIAAWCFLPIVLNITAGIIHENFFESRPVVMWYITQTSNKKIINSTVFKMNYINNKEIPSCTIMVKNIGNKSADNLYIYWKILSNDNEIVNENATYFPRQIQEKCKKVLTKKNFEEEVSFVQPNAWIQYKIQLKNFIKSDEDYLCEISSKESIWKNETETSISNFNIENDPQFISNRVSVDKINRNINYDKGLSLNGYDPIKMSLGLFILLQDKHIISKREANRIEKLLLSYKDGVLIGGINLLKFNELVVVNLLLKRKISEEQKSMIFKNAKNAGGVLVDCYNIIVMETEILNALYKNKRISLAEGQEVIDYAVVGLDKFKEQR